MNCPSRVDPAALPNGWNQNPSPLALDTNADSVGIVNIRQNRDHGDHRMQLEIKPEPPSSSEPNEEIPREKWRDLGEGSAPVVVVDKLAPEISVISHRDARLRNGKRLHRVYQVLLKFLKFIGPGFLVAVAYIDPGNYATDASAGANFRFQLLVMVLVSNIIAIYLQVLCVKLGTVTGLNLAENIKEHCPRYLNYALYFFAEAAIISTDIAEVIGTAIALNLLIKVPLVAGCAISILDVLILLAFYRPSASVIGVRAFECFVVILVFGVAICFSVELSLIHIPDVGSVFRGYVPSSALVQSQGLVQACGILGATVMPHSLYLGSGIVQPRLREFDMKEGNINASEDEVAKYKPTLAAIRSCLSYSITELVIALFTVALFVNSAILIVCGASLYNVDGSTNATLFQVHDLLSQTLAPAAGTIFALGLLFSGTAAGIVCTIAGQFISEGQLNWSVKPWIRRLVTRAISITPSIIIAGAVGSEGLTNALQGTQVALSVILPFTSAPLIWFTCRRKIMTVQDDSTPGGVNLQNGRITALFGVIIWLLIVVLNVALIVLVALPQH